MKRRERTCCAALLGLFVAGCAVHSPMTGTSTTTVPAGELSRNASGEAAAVVRRPLETLQPPVVAASPGAAASNALYVCMTDSTGGRKQTAIEFAPNVAALCTRHPEMGPCQYERQQCRSRGGRVFTANGQEITRAIEDAYDRKVMRVRFRAN